MIKRGIHFFTAFFIMGVVRVVSSPPAFCQDYPRHELNAQRLIDEIFPQQNLDINYSELYENFLQRYSHPLELNHASEEELRSLYVLNEQQIEALIAWREKNGLLLSPYELQAIPEFDLPVILRLMPFVQVRDLSTTIDRTLLARLASEGDSYLIVRYGRTLERQKGYLKTTDTAARYAGSPNQVYARFRLSRPGDFSFGMTTEKDAGEAFTFRPRDRYYGMDFISFHAQVLRKGWIRNWIAGDFTAQFGQGLMLGGGFGMGKGSETITTIRRSNLGFMPYSSVGESNFLRGTATSLSLSNNVTMHAFASGLRKDAVTKADSMYDDYSFISSFAETGLHRTPSEIKSRKKITEVNFGSVLEFKVRSFDAGVMFHQTRFSLPITRKPSVYNQFSFKGDQNTNAGIFLNYSKNSVSFFSEAAKTFDHGMAVTAGLLASVMRRLDLSLLYRNYQKDFISFYSNAIAESTLPQNESGFYWGWKYAWPKRFSMAGYADLFHFPWLRYRAYSPADGSEWLLRFNYQPSKTVSAYTQLRQESRLRNLSDDNNLYKTDTGVKTTGLINFDYSVSPKLNFKTRAQFSRYSIHRNTTRGFALLQDASFDAGRFSFTGRFALFHTDDYDNRLYVYEQDVWLAFSFPAYFGNGVRTYAMVQYRLTKGLALWLRWSRTRYTDRTEIGTGGETISGNERNDVKLQVRVKL